jgi:hypothetical protein
MWPPGLRFDTKGFADGILSRPELFGGRLADDSYRIARLGFIVGKVPAAPNGEAYM